MRCREAKEKLCARREGDLEAKSEEQDLREHLKECMECNTFEKRLHRLDNVLSPSPTPAHSRISTDNIMLAIQRHRCISQQLEDIRQQQSTRVAHMRGTGTALFALVFFTLGSIPLLLFAAAITQTDLLVKTLSLLDGAIDVLFIVGQYLYAGLTVIARNNWLLSGIAFAVVIMMGMWLRLMRHPQERYPQEV
jgi:hypothetical protein